MIGERSVCLGYCHRGDIRNEFLAAVLFLQATPEGGLIGRVANTSAGGLLPVARNHLAGRFLDGGAEQWLWMVDTDVVFDPGHLALLADAADPDARPWVCGPVPVLARDGQSVYPNVYVAEGGDPAVPGLFAPVAGLPATGVYDQADGCGAAFQLIHRAVFEKIRAAEGGDWWFDQFRAPGGRLMGEDLSFCVRASRAGYRPAVVCAARPGHVKDVIVRLPEP